MTKPASNLFCNGKLACSAFPKMRNKTRMTTLINFIQPSIANPYYTSNEKRKKSKQNKKQNEFKLERKSKTFTVCRWPKYYLENFEDTTKNYKFTSVNLLKVAGYKNNIQIFCIFCVLTMNYQKEKLRKTFHL